MEGLIQAQRDGVVVGLTDVSGVAQRLDVDVLLSKEPDTFNLFLLALEELQKMDESVIDDKMSYVQVAGIHGLPHRAWDGVVPPGEKQGGSYCPHGTEFFPTWHRPYLAMMEQTISHKMYEIADTFEDRNRWVRAVDKFRLPYWDYYRPRGGESVFPGIRDPDAGLTKFAYDFSVPHILTFPDVMVRRPGNEEAVQMANPLYAFRFPPGVPPSNEWNALDADNEQQGITIMASRSMTTRHPAQNRSDKSDVDTLNSTVVKARAQGVEMLLDMIEWPAYGDYLTFSNASQSNRSADGSLEGLHNMYHGLIGGNGHMGRVPIAAFDPIFWLHHANIDRLFAIWQSTHRSFMQDPAAQIPLYPFRSSPGNGSFWNSDEVADTERFGYTYPDIDGLRNPEAIKARFDRNYRWSLHAAARGNNDSDPPEEMRPIDVLHQYFFELGGVGVLPPHLAGSQHPLHARRAHVPHSEPDESEMETDFGPGGPVQASGIITDEPGPLDRHTEGRVGMSDEELLENESPGAKVIRQWFIDSKVRRTAYNGSFTVYFFTGRFEDDPSTYQKAPTLAGLNHFFVSPRQMCANCDIQAEQDAHSTDTISITPILLDFVDTNNHLGSLHPDDALPFLKANLRYRIVGINSVQLQPDQVGLNLSLSTTLSFSRPEMPIPEFDSATSYEM